MVINKTRSAIISILLISFIAGFAFEDLHKRWSIEIFDPLGTTLLDLDLHAGLMKYIGKDEEKVNNILALKVEGDVALLKSYLSGEIKGLSDEEYKYICRIITSTMRRYKERDYWKENIKNISMLSSEYCN